MLVGPELLTQGLLQGDRLSGDDMHQGAALEPGKEVLVENRRIGLLTHDHAATGTPEGFVGCGGDELGVRDRRGMEFGGDESGGMRDVRHEDRPDLFGDLFECGKIESPGVGTPTNHNHLRFVGPGQLLHLREVNPFRLRMHPIVDDAEEAAGEVHWASVG